MTLAALEPAGPAPAQGVRQVWVAFADLAGFTALGERLSCRELAWVGSRLTMLASEALTPRVRLVKSLGDGVMLVSRGPSALMDSIVRLVAAVDQQVDGFPPLRAGVAGGAAVEIEGDWYGQPVNVASRIAAVARPGSVLATWAVHMTLADEYRWSPAGSRRFKGIETPTELFRARPLLPAG
jgi:adenylate cyclase